MDKFKYKITITAEIESFDEGDSLDLLQDTFGLGEQGSGVVITDVEWEVGR